MNVIRNRSGSWLVAASGALCVAGTVVSQLVTNLRPAQSSSPVQVTADLIIGAGLAWTLALAVLYRRDSHQRKTWLLAVAAMFFLVGVQATDWLVDAGVLHDDSLVDIPLWVSATVLLRRILRRERADTTLGWLWTLAVVTEVAFIVCDFQEGLLVSPWLMPVESIASFSECTEKIAVGCHVSLFVLLGLSLRSSVQAPLIQERTSSTTGAVTTWPSARRFAAVTTCHAQGFAEYGQTMVASFLAHWPERVPLMLYFEGFTPPVSAGRIEAYDLMQVSLGLASFKARHADNPAAHGSAPVSRSARVAGFSIPLPARMPKEPYRWDAVRFSHKAFAIFDAARRSDADVLIWLDADSLFFDDVSLRELNALAPAECVVACLRRPHFSETGFVAYNLRHRESRRLLRDFEDMYQHDLLFDEDEFHDAYLFDVVSARAEARGAVVHDIGEGIGERATHVLINSRLGRFMDHMKGGRKADGQSRWSDLVAERTEQYWLDIKLGRKPAATAAERHHPET